jgi:hypothetical protein
MIAGDKIGEIYLHTDGSRCHAYWHPADGAADAYLCSISLKAYNGDLRLRDLFFDLASEVAVHGMRAAGHNVTLRTPHGKVASTMRAGGELSDAG